MNKKVEKSKQNICSSIAKKSIVIVNRLPLMEFLIAMVSLPSPFQTDTTLFTYQIETYWYPQMI